MSNTIIIGLLVIALGFLLIPFSRNVKALVFFTSLLSLMSLSIYFYTANIAGLNWWDNQGKEHYLLMQKVEDLGGIEGLTHQVELRVQEHPNDPQGWEILGKLYLSQNKNEEAKKFFEKAQSLRQVKA